QALLKGTRAVAVDEADKGVAFPPVAEPQSLAATSQRTRIFELLTADQYEPAPLHLSEIQVRTARMKTRDGTALATDLYLPPSDKAPSVLMRTPYGRAHDRMVGVFLALARRGYAVVAQDCRG